MKAVTLSRSISKQQDALIKVTQKIPYTDDNRSSSVDRLDEGMDQGFVSGVLKVYKCVNVIEVSTKILDSTT